MNTIQGYQADESASTRIAVWGWTWNYVQDHPAGGGFAAYLQNHITCTSRTSTARRWAPIRSNMTRRAPITPPISRCSANRASSAWGCGCCSMSPAWSGSSCCAAASAARRVRRTVDRAARHRAAERPSRLSGRLAVHRDRLPAVRLHADRREIGLDSYVRRTRPERPRIAMGAAAGAAPTTAMPA